MTQTERLNGVIENTNALLEQVDSPSEATRNTLDTFRAQRTFYTDDLPPVKKTVRAVYRRFNGKVSFIP